MKTIKKNGEYQRLPDHEAENFVKSGWNYCPKHEWKDQVRPKKKEKKKDEEIAK